MNKKDTIKSLNNAGQRLRELRIHAGKTQEEMSRILGLNKTSYGKYERLENYPNFRLLHKLAGLYNVSIDYLVCGRGTLLYGVEKQGEEGSGSGKDTAELFYIMERLPLVRYSVLTHYLRFRNENRDLIDQELAKQKE